jgi:hypothetical protein
MNLNSARILLRGAPVPTDNRRKPSSRDEAVAEPAEEARRPRYLVVDTGDPTGDMDLPSGKRGRVLGSFHSVDLAFALAQAQREEGQRILIFDSDQLRKLTKGARHQPT